MPEELKFEAAIWELYERVIREGLLGEQSTSWERDAVNAGLYETYEKLEPYLKALRTLHMQRGYRQALDSYKPPNVDIEVVRELAAERKRVDESLKDVYTRVKELEETFKDEIHRVHMLRALRDELPSPDEQSLPEPP